MIYRDCLVLQSRQRSYTQREDKHFIDILNKVRLGNVDSEVETTCSIDLQYLTYALHVFAENVPVFNHNKVMLDQINGRTITIDTIDSIPIDCGCSDSQIMAARNRSTSQTDC